MLDKQAQLEETGMQTKASLVEAGIHRWVQIKQLPAAGWINGTSVCGGSGDS